MSDALNAFGSVSTAAKEDTVTETTNSVTEVIQSFGKSLDKQNSDSTSVSDSATERTTVKGENIAKPFIFTKSIIKSKDKPKGQSNDNNTSEKGSYAVESVKDKPNITSARETITDDLFKDVCVPQTFSEDMREVNKILTSSGEQSKLAHTNFESAEERKSSSSSFSSEDSVKRAQSPADTANTNGNITQNNDIPSDSKHDIYDKDLSEFISDIKSTRIYSVSNKLFNKLFNKLIEKVKTNSIIKKFEEGNEVYAGDFVFLQKNKQLMLYRYAGVCMDLHIPSHVGNLPVTYVHPDFLSDGISLKNNYKVRGIKNLFSGDYIEQLSMESISKIGHGLCSITLPNTLRFLPSDAFYGCQNIKCIVIPETLTFLGQNAFEGAGITDVYFNGPAPMGFRFCKLPENVFVSKQFVSTYKEIE